MQSFKPAFYITNSHLQTFLGSCKLRHQWVLQRCEKLLKHSESITLRTTQDVRLQAEFTNNTNGNGLLAIIFHGWEGSSNSSYVLGSANTLFNMGYSIARLNFRDHGDTHHLNKSPFNSVRLDEICEAITHLSERCPNNGIIFVGYSLGGNFALRLSAQEKLRHLNLRHTIAICPAIHPFKASRTIEEGMWLYHRYFLNKWRNSLIKKYRYYPEIMQSADDLKVNRLNKMNDFFVPLHTGYDSTEKYLAAYKITQDTLNAIHHNCDIIYADDDPIINAEDFDRLEQTEHVHIHPQVYGGHCAFMQNWQLYSWTDSALQELLEPVNNNIPNFP